MKTYSIVATGEKNRFRIVDNETEDFVTKLETSYALFTGFVIEVPLEFTTKEEAQDWIDKNTWLIVK